MLIFIVQETQSQQGDEYQSANSTRGSYVVDYGPIRIRHRRNISQTLATGRRGKDEPVSDEEATKRELRRAKNRIAAQELKRKRDQIEFDLIQKLDELEKEKNYLEDESKKLEQHKAQLNRAVYNAKQTPLIPLIVDINMPFFFEPLQRHGLSVDLQPLLKTIHEQFSLSDG